MSGKKSMIAIALLLAISILALLFVSGNIHMESEQKDALKITFLKVGKVDAIIVHFTELSGRHSVLERPLSEVNGRLFFS